MPRFEDCSSFDYVVSYHVGLLDAEVCLGAAVHVSWTAPRNHSTSDLIALFSRNPTSEFFYTPAAQCIPDVNRTIGNCTFAVASLSGSYVVRYLADGRFNSRVASKSFATSNCKGRSDSSGHDDTGCDGVDNSGTRFDSCGVCGGNGHCDGCSTSVKTHL
jgi:hypothetical protein